MVKERQSAYEESDEDVAQRHHAERREQNRTAREAQRGRPDSRENIGSSPQSTTKSKSKKYTGTQAEQRRKARDAERMVGQDRPDSRTSLNKESKRRKEAHAKIDENIEKVKSRQRWEEEEEEDEPTPSRRAAPRNDNTPPQLRQPSTLQNIGRNVGNYVARNSGQPSWLGRGGGMPPAMRTGSGKLPPAYSMGSGQLPPALRTGSGKLPPVYSMGMGGQPPAWLFGGIPGAPVPTKVKGKRKSHPLSPNGLPPWFRY